MFLISASPKDAEKIYKALEYRYRQKQCAKVNVNSTSRINQLNSEKEDDQEPPEKKASKSEEAE